MSESRTEAQWRGNSSANTHPRRRGIIILLVALLASICIFSVLLFWMQPIREPHVVSITMTRDAAGHAVPFAENDRSVFTLNNKPNALPLNPTRDAIRLTLNALKKRGANEPLFLVIDAAVSVTPDGQLAIDSPDADADTGRNLLTLSDVLRSLQQCRARHQLVVLNLHGNCDWPTLALRDLDAIDDTRRLAILACSPGEESLASQQLQHSIFAYYWQEALLGNADGWNESTTSDSRVSVVEVATFLRFRVSRWAKQNRGQAQNPLLVGTGSDFVISAQSRPAPESTVPPDASPWSEFAWMKRDEWQSLGRDVQAPKTFLQMERALLQAERDAHAGASQDFLKAKLMNVLNGNEREPELSREPEPKLFAERLLALHPFTEELRAFVNSVPSRTDKPLSPRPEPDAWKTRTPVDFQQAAIQIVTTGSPISLPVFRELMRVLLAHEKEIAHLEFAFLQRVEFATPSNTEKDWPAEFLTRYLRIGLEFEAISANRMLYQPAAKLIDDTHKEWIAAQAFALAPHFAPRSLAENMLAKVEASLRILSDSATAQRTLLAVRLALARRFPDTDLSTSTRSEIRTAIVELDRALQEVEANQDADALRQQTITWNETANRLGELQQRVRAKFQPRAIQELLKKLEASDAPPATVSEANTLLASAMLATPERFALTTACRKLRERWNQETLQDDSGPIPPSIPDPREIPNNTDAGRKNPEIQPLPNFNTPDLQPYWQWLATRFQHENYNPIGVPGDPTSPYLARVTTACRKLGNNPTAIAHPDYVVHSGAALTPALPAINLDIQVRLLNARTDTTTQWKAISFATEYIQAEIPSDISLSPVQAKPLLAHISAGKNPAAFPNAEGILLECLVESRPYFLRVPVNTDALRDRFTLFARNNPDAPLQPATELKLRPHGIATPVSLVLTHPSAAPLSAIVRLPTFDRETAALTLAPSTTLPLVFPAKIAAAPAPPIPTAPDFNAAPEVLEVEILDAKTRTLKQSFRLPIRVEDPANYAQIGEVLYSPKRLGSASEIRTRIQPGSAFGVPDCPVEMVFNSERNPGMTIRDAALKGILKSNGDAVPLYAKQLEWAQPGEQRIIVSFHADGVERVRTFTANITPNSGVVKFNPLEDPAVRIRCTEFATDAVPLPVIVETDHAPNDATLEIQIGTESAGQFVADKKHPISPAKLRQSSIKFDAKGNMIFRASIQDVSAKVEVEKLTGTRIVRARMLDRNGKEIALNTRRVTFDGNIPGDVRFLNLPPLAARGKPLKVQATCEPPVAGIAEVKFFLGKPMNDLPPMNAVVVAGKLADAKRNIWEAQLPLGDAVAPVDVSVVFISKSKQQASTTEVVELRDAAELNKPKPGSIAGTVLEGSVPQVGLAVQLFEVKDLKKAKASATTKEGGTFEFNELPPGKYQLVCEKPTTNRTSSANVEVLPAATAKANLSLLLK